jgi:hypothetical protein
MVANQSPRKQMMFQEVDDRSRLTMPRHYVEEAEIANEGMA